MYWGKVIGTLAGLATTKPLLALVGLILGHQFDRGFAARARASREGPFPRLEETYVDVLFKTMGHLAKSDGRVTEAEIRAARSVMHRLKLRPAQVRNAIDAFDAGKAESFPLQGTIRALRREHARGPERRRLFVQLLLEVALAKGRIMQPERSLLWTVCQELEIGRVELAQIEAMSRAGKGYEPVMDGVDVESESVRQAYETLGVQKSASNDEIKRAYRRLINRYHPDKIAAGNPDPRDVDEAGKRTREIRAAYESLKAHRSIR